jgi:excinuclease ABC subunit A
MNRLVDRGNTIIVIEHNMDVIKSCDWIIDMGPDGGVAGGQLCAQGTPEQICKKYKTPTTQFLGEELKR